jgi:hypothetical protein
VPCFFPSYCPLLLLLATAFWGMDDLALNRPLGVLPCPDELHRLSELNRLGVSHLFTSCWRRRALQDGPLEDALISQPPQAQENHGEEQLWRREAAVHRPNGRHGPVLQPPGTALVVATGLPWRDLSSDWLKLGLSLALTGLMGVGQSSGNLLPQQAAAVHSGGGGGDGRSGLSCTGTEKGSHLMLSQAAYRWLPSLHCAQGISLISSFGWLKEREL